MSGEVASVTFVDFPDRVAALRSERDAIIAERPRYNERITSQRSTGTVGERIRCAREDMNFSQAHLGRLLGVRGSMVCRYEIAQVEPSLATLSAIAALTRTSRAWLAFGDGPRHMHDEVAA